MEPFTRTAIKGHNVGYCTCHESLARSMMDTLQQIAFCFNYPAKRLRVLQVELELDVDAKAGMNSGTKLQSLCEKEEEETVTIISQLQQERGRSMDVEYIVGRRCGTCSEIRMDHFLQEMNI